MTTYFPTAPIEVGAGDSVYVAPSVSLDSQAGDGIADLSYGRIIVDGSVFGEDSGIYMGGAAGQTTSITIGTGGSVYTDNTQGSHPAISCGLGESYITNYGLVASDGSGGGIAMGSGVITNYGHISGLYGIDVSGDSTIINRGTISNVSEDDDDARFAIGTDSSAVATVVNTGTVDGLVVLAGSTNTFDSSSGFVYGDIIIEQTTQSAFANTVIGGINGGNIMGGINNDILTANQSKMAADEHSQFVLDGAGGTNSLYGGGAYNQFMAGDADGGRNQIHGGLSQMNGVTGYTNNIISFIDTPQSNSVYIDLLNGHNAYLYANANHSGALTFEDSIQNVPNVLGSTGGDVIRADNGTDTIEGSIGADILYAGTGFDTFVYNGYADSNTVTGYDTIAGFLTGKDKIDLSALGSDPSHLAILSSGSATRLYVEKTPGTFNSTTDLAISIQGANAVKAGDVIF